MKHRKDTVFSRFLFERKHSDTQHTRGGDFKAVSFCAFSFFQL